MKHDNINLLFGLSLALCFFSGHGFLMAPLASSKLLPLPGHCSNRPIVQATPSHDRTALRSLFSDGTIQTESRETPPIEISPQQVKSKGRLRAFFSNLFRRISVQWTCFAVMMMVMRSSPIAATEMSALAQQDSMYVMEEAQVASRLESLVERYVKTHMFSDESIDVASDVYREVSYDAAPGGHHKKLSDITMSILGQPAFSSSAVRAWYRPGHWVRAVELYLARRGVSKKQFNLGYVIFHFFCVFAVWRLWAYFTDRADRAKLADWKNRFGDDFTVSATYKNDWSR